MSIKAEIEKVEVEQPTQLAWSQSSRSSRESRMDFETSVDLRCYLSEDFSTASSWGDLVRRLFAKGFHLMFDRDRLILVNDHTGVDLCTCRFLGFGFAELATVLGKPCIRANTRRIIANNPSSFV